MSAIYSIGNDPSGVFQRRSSQKQLFDTFFGDFEGFLAKIY